MQQLKVAILDNSLKKHFVSKYNLIDVDANGNGVYEFEWSQDDIDMARTWDHWKNNGKKKAPYEVKVWQETMIANGVEVAGVEDPDEKADKSTFLKVLIGAGLGVAGMWMLSTKEEPDEAKKEVQPDDVKRAVSLKSQPRRITYDFGNNDHDYD